MFSAHFKQNVAELDSCCICSESLAVRSSQLMDPCGHSLCEPCIKKLESSAANNPHNHSFHCPLCRSVVTAYSPNLDYQLLSAAAGLPQPAHIKDNSKNFKAAELATCILENLATSERKLIDLDAEQKKSAAEKKDLEAKLQKAEQEKKELERKIQALTASFSVVDSRRVQAEARVAELERNVAPNKSGAVNDGVSAAALPRANFMKSPEDSKHKVDQALNLLNQASKNINDLSVILAKGAELAKHPKFVPWQTKLLQRKEGLIALGKGLLTIEQAYAFSSAQLDPFLDENGIGLQVLEEKLLTVEQVQALNPSLLKRLLCPEGLTALRERLLTFSQIKECQPSTLAILLSPNGIAALRQRLISSKEIAKFWELESLLTDQAIEAARKAAKNSEKKSQVINHEQPKSHAPSLLKKQEKQADIQKKKASVATSILAFMQETPAKKAEKEAAKESYIQSREKRKKERALKRAERSSSRIESLLKSGAVGDDLSAVALPSVCLSSERGVTSIDVAEFPYDLRRDIKHL